MAKRQRSHMVCKRQKRHQAFDQRRRTCCSQGSGAGSTDGCPVSKHCPENWRSHMMQNPFVQCSHQGICVCLMYQKWRHYTLFWKPRALVPLSGWWRHSHLDVCSTFCFFLSSFKKYAEAGNKAKVSRVLFFCAKWQQSCVMWDLFDTWWTQTWDNAFNEFIILSSEDTRTSSGNQLAWLKRCSISLFLVWPSKFTWNFYNGPFISTDDTRIISPYFLQDLADVYRREEPEGDERNVDRISGLGSSRWQYWLVYKGTRSANH